MKRLRFAFDTTMKYSVPVRQHQIALRCLPLTDGSQRLEQYTIQLEPGHLPPAFHRRVWQHGVLVQYQPAP